MTRVGVVGYGVIGQRLADGVALQKDMELIGVADTAPTLALRALKARGMPYKVFCVLPSTEGRFIGAGIPIQGNISNLLDQVDIVLDATSAGVGSRNKEDYYMRREKRAVFQGGEKNEVADVFFHGYANYERGLGKQFLKLTSCNTTGLIRAVDILDRTVGVEKLAITIMRRVADPGDTHRGLTNVLKIDPVPSHQAVDLMTIMPHVPCTGVLVHTPVTHGHIISIVATPTKSISVKSAIDLFKSHPRIMVVRISDGFDSNASFFRFARDKGNLRGDMYEIGIWEETMALSGKDLIFSIYIPQEAVVIPETMDAIRASMSMQTERLEAVGLTNKYLGLCR